ncbi:MAG TPA: sensor histidine kinase [Niastella sp.]
MLKTLIYLCFIITAAIPAMGQGTVPRNLSQPELYKLLQTSKQDSDRIEILFELGRTYMKQVNSDRKKFKMDTAAEFFNRALRLSDTLQLKGFWFESTLLVGEAHLNKDDTAEGKKRFYEVAAIYHAKGDVQREARTWLRLARKIAWHKEYTSEIDGYFDKAIKMYAQAGNAEKEASARSFLVEFLYETRRPHLMETELLRIVEINSKIGNKFLAYDYYTLSSLFRYRGAYEKALLYATKCVEAAEQNKDTQYLSLYYGEMGLVNDELGRVAESSYWYRKALDKRIEEKDKLTILTTARFLIRQLIKQKKTREALTLIDSLRLVYPPKEPFERAVVAQSYAYCFDALKQFPKAEQSFLTMAAAYSKGIPDNETYCLANMDMGKFYLQHRQFKKAKGYLDTALANKGSDRLIDLRELYQMLFTADSALGNYAAAVKDLKQYEFLNDSIYNERKSRQIEELTIQYETQKKEQSIRLLEKEKRLQKTELTKVRNTISWIIGVAILFIVIIALLVNNARIKQRTNKTLQVQQKQIEKKNESLQRLVEEKEWLVREIHHRVKNNFHMVMGLLGTQAAYLKSTEAIQAIAESQQRIQAMSLVHQKLYQSENMSAINMADYIHELVDYLKDSFQTGRRIRFNLQIEPVKLNVSHCIPLGLLLNEAITNAIKHAFPGEKEGTINIALKKTASDHFLLSVKDNGIGLPATFNSNKQVSMGIKLMRGLSDDIDAGFDVRSNGGTEILLNFTDDDKEQPN